MTLLESIKTLINANLATRTIAPNIPPDPDKSDFTPYCVKHDAKQEPAIIEKGKLMQSGLF